MIRNNNKNKNKKMNKNRKLLVTRNVRNTIYRSLLDDSVVKDLNIAYQLFAISSATFTGYSFSNSLTQTGSNNRQDSLVSLFGTNSEFNQLKNNYSFLKIDSIRLKITTQLGYTTKVMTAPPLYFKMYLTNSVPLSIASFAQQDGCVKHDVFNSQPTTVIYNLPKVFEYYPGFNMGSEQWISIKAFPGYQLLYIGFGYFQDPQLDVSVSTALPIVNVEVSFRTRFAGSLLASN